MAIAVSIAATAKVDGGGAREVAVKRPSGMTPGLSTLKSGMSSWHTRSNTSLAAKFAFNS